MKYIKKLNINFNDWDEVDQSDKEYIINFNEDNFNQLKKGDSVHCYKNGQILHNGKIFVIKDQWYNVVGDIDENGYVQFRTGGLHDMRFEFASIYFDLIKKKNI